MDGQFHAIEFDPSATATEVLKLVKAKIGLRDNAQGETTFQTYKYTFIYSKNHFWLLHFGKCVLSERKNKDMFC
jgi:hypothetical protein